MEKEAARVLKKIRRVRWLNEDKKYLYARSLAATQDERWWLHETFLSQSLVIAISIVMISIGSACSRKNARNDEINRAEIESKLNVVLQQMVSRCEDPTDREALKAAKLFHKIQGLSMDVVGFSVPINSGSNHAHVSFTLDHVQKTPSEVLAAEGLEDLQTAKASGRKGPNG